MSRRSILFLCQTLPYPPDGGVWIRTYNLLRVLARHFDVTMFCFERALSPGDGYAADPRASLEALGELGPVEAFAIPQRHSRVRFAADHLRSLLTGRVFTHYLYDSAAMRARVRQAMGSGAFDLVHVDSLDLSAYLPLFQGLPVACTHHNVESALLDRRARADRSPAVRRYAAHQARLMEATEREWCARVALNVVVSEVDAEALRCLAPQGRYVVVPNGVDVHAFRPGAEQPGGGLVFTGGANWFPNRDALEHFCRDTLPILRRKRPDLRVTWVGAARDEDRRRYRQEHGVELTGYVDDIRPFVHAAECFIVPLRLGGGSRLKILDAWALGKAVVSTSVGCEGLAAEDGHNIRVADGGPAFAAAIESVLDDAGLRARLGQAARATVERSYAWEIVGGRLVEAYDEMLDGASKVATV